LIAIAVIAVGVVGGVLALTVLNTDEDANAPEPGAALGSTGATATTGPTGVTSSSTLDYAQVIPQPIDGPLLGVNLTAYTRDGYSQPSVRQAMMTLAELGSTAVTLVPTWYMKSANANRIAPDTEKSPSDESLVAAIGMARSAGLLVVIKPHVDVIDDTYRGDIQPTDREAWFRSYEQFIDHFASISASNGVELFVAGTELKSLSSETDRWREVIRTVRDRYTGPVTYAANWDETDQVQFWDELDAIGVDAYYPLSQEGSGEAPTLKSLTDAWRNIADQLRAKSEQWSRPVILTEVGYPSQVGATAKPYEVTDQPVDQGIQALAYHATFNALSGSDWLRGISWWSWRADPSPEENLDIDYTPEDKKAQGELARGQWIFEG
jgi:hypothetical protein